MNLSDEDKSTVNIQSTHAIDIFAFVEADEIPLSCFETPYHLAPGPGGERVYVLLRKVLERTRKIGIAHVVIQARRRLAALIPCGQVLVLNTLRTFDNVHSLATASRRAKRLTSVQPTERELALAARVVEDMTRKWEIIPGPGDNAPSSGSDMMLPRVRWQSGRVIKARAAKGDTATEQAPNAKAARDRTNRTRTNRTIYQAQRESRPRSRVRRTYH